MVCGQTLDGIKDLLKPPIGLIHELIELNPRNRLVLTALSSEEIDIHVIHHRHRRNLL